MSTNRLLYLGWLAFISLMILPGGSLSKDVVVNLMIDIDSPASPTPEQMNMVSSSIVNLTNQIDSRGLDSTFFVTGDMASSDRLEITYIGSKANHELALHGNATGEKLGSLSYSEQEALLNKAKGFIDAAHICGGRITVIRGFMPQSFDQNENSYGILENMGFLYDAGFKAGIQYLPGHQNDTWPYRIANYSLYAVPVSTYNFAGERVYLYDRFIKEEKGLNGTKWYDLLVGKFDEASVNGDPVVVIFSNQVSGSSDYLDAYKNFVEYAISKNAKFVTTMELINMTEVKNATGKLPTLSGVKPSVCFTCGQKNESKGSLSIGVTVTHQENCTSCYRSTTNVTKTS